MLEYFARHRCERNWSVDLFPIGVFGKSGTTNIWGGAFAPPAPPGYATAAYRLAIPVSSDPRVSHVQQSWCISHWWLRIVLLLHIIICLVYFTSRSWMYVILVNKLNTSHKQLHLLYPHFKFDYIWKMCVSIIELRLSVTYV